MRDRRSNTSALPVFLDTSRQQALGYEQIPLTDASSSLHPPANTVSAQIKVEGGRVRYRDDGVDPTTTVGMPLDDGETLIYDVSMRQISFIAVDENVKLNVLYYGG